MKKICLVLFFSLFLTNLFSQKENFDVITYSPPSGWKKDVSANSINYIIVNKENNSWCQIGIIRSTVSKGSIETDFSSEWQDIIIKNYKPSAAPQLNKVHETDGWKILEGVSSFRFNNTDAIAMLVTMSGFTRCTSIVVTTNSQDYLKDVDAVLSSLEFKKPETAVNTDSPENLNQDNPILGTWGANASDQSSFRVNNGVMNYITRQYTFNADGTYSFISKAYDPLVQNIILGKENGTYLISGDIITIIPSESVLEGWSKNGGRDEWGKLLNTEKLDPEKVSYKFSKHFFEGVHKLNLVLRAANPTRRDGPFSSNSTFTNAWYYFSVPAKTTLVVLPDGK